MSKRFFFACILLLLMALPVLAEEQTARLEASRAAVQTFAQTLMGELQTALQTDPIQAIKICHDRAPEIARTLSAETGLEIGRTSLRYRNPDNRPVPWQAVVLKDFDARLATGENPQDIEFSQVFSRWRYEEFRYMKAIPTMSLCLDCHGTPEQIAPEVADVLQTLYPRDKATDYDAGEIRGAFVVTERIR